MGVYMKVSCRDARQCVSTVYFHVSLCLKGHGGLYESLSVETHGVCVSLRCASSAETHTVRLYGMALSCFVVSHDSWRFI
jgi:hypothetical protein